MHLSGLRPGGCMLRLGYDHTDVKDDNHNRDLLDFLKILAHDAC